MTTAEAHPPTWQTYVIVRFSFIACYSSAILTPQGESPDGDGEAFLGPLGSKRLVYGGINLDHGDLLTSLAATRRRFLAHGGTVTYEHPGHGFFIISGTQGGSILYEKHFQTGSTFKTMLLLYPASQRAMFDPLIAPMAKCFSSLSASKTKP